LYRELEIKEQNCKKRKQQGGETEVREETKLKCSATVYMSTLSCDYALKCACMKPIPFDRACYLEKNCSVIHMESAALTHQHI
jgi:hypothetical protein